MTPRAEHFMDTVHATCLRRFGDKLEGRLYNWKFDTALVHAEHDHANPDAPASERPNAREMGILRELAAEYANLGWADGRVAARVEEALDELYQERMSNHQNSTASALPEIVLGYLDEGLFEQAKKAAKKARCGLTKAESALLDELAGSYGDCGRVENESIAARIERKVTALLACRAR